METIELTIPAAMLSRRQISDGRFEDGTEYRLECSHGNAVLTIIGNGFKETVAANADELLGLWSVDTDDGTYRIFVQTEDRNPFDAFERRPDGRLRLVSPELLSPSDWSAIAGAFNRLGYATNDAETARLAFTRRSAGRGCILQPDQQEAVETLFGGKAEDDSEWAEAAGKMERLAIERFGTTDVQEFAGFITRNGSMLDFSYEGRQRDMDHREVNDLFDEWDGPIEPNIGDRPGANSGNLIRFMNLGNIRVSDTGIDLSVEPTDAQRRTIARKAAHRHGELNVDFSAKSGTTVGSLRFPIGTSASAILGAIDRYFETGFVEQT